MLGRRVESIVTHWGRHPAKRDLKGLNPPIQVHVKDGVFIMPDPGIRSRYFVADEEDPIVTRIGLDLGYRGASIRPSLDGRLHSHGVTGLVKYEIGRPAADRKLLIGKIVKHVALVRMRLAPGVFRRGNVGGLAIISRAWVLRWDQVSHVCQDSVRYAVVVMPAVVVRVRWERARERIDPRARPDLVLIAVQP